MPEFTMSIDYTMFCEEESVSECVHKATLNIKTRKTTDEEQVVSNMVSVLEDLSGSTDLNKDGKVYHFGSLSIDDLVKDAVRLFPIYLDKPDESIRLIFLKTL